MNTGPAGKEKSFDWGQVSGKPNNKGIATDIVVFSTLLAAIIYLVLLWPVAMLSYQPESRPGAEDGYNGIALLGFLVLAIGALLLYMIFNPHYRLDGVQADAVGIDIFSVIYRSA